MSEEARKKLFVIGYSGEEKRGLKYLGMNSFGMDECPDEMRFIFVKCARPPQLSESDPPALRCEALRAGGGQASLSLEIKLGKPRREGRKGFFWHGFH